MIEVPTRWGGIPVQYHYLTHSAATKLVVLFPGPGYTLDASVMWYVARAAFDAGCDGIGIELSEVRKMRLSVEALKAIALPKPIRSLRESDQSKVLHFAWTFYDHIAGEVDVAVDGKLSPYNWCEIIEWLLLLTN